jgi:hypothetical protein
LLEATPIIRATAPSVITRIMTGIGLVAIHSRS